MSKKKMAISCAATSLLIITSMLAWPQMAVAEVVLGPDSQVFPSVSADFDNFGSTVAIRGNYAVIGASRDESNNNIGCAYIFQQDVNGVWRQAARLLASDGEPNDRFGYSAAISEDGSYIVIGGFKTNAAYVFHRDGDNWTETAKLTAATGSCFGEGVAISGEYVIIGSRGEDGRTGAAYIFQRNGDTWTQMVRLTDPDCNINDYFGGSVAISGDYAVVGAPNDSVPYTYTGSVCFFQRNGAIWERMCRLKASDPAKDDKFGFSVAIEGDYAVVGSVGDDDTADWGGALYVFHRNDTEWIEVAKLTAPDAHNSDGLGCSLSISGNNIVASTHAFTSSYGAVYVYHRAGNEWGLLEKFKTSDSSSWPTTYAAIDREKILIGMLGNNTNGEYAGAAYFTTVPYPDGDVNLDYRVDFLDFAVMTENWLECTLDCD